MKTNNPGTFTVWTVLTVTDDAGDEVFRMDVDGTGPDEEYWLIRLAYVAGFRYPEYTFTFTYERRDER